MDEFGSRSSSNLVTKQPPLLLGRISMGIWSHSVTGTLMIVVDETCNPKGVQDWIQIRPC